MNRFYIEPRLTYGPNRRPRTNYCILDRQAGAGFAGFTPPTAWVKDDLVTAQTLCDALNVQRGGVWKGVGAVQESTAELEQANTIRSLSRSLQSYRDRAEALQRVNDNREAYLAYVIAERDEARDQLKAELGKRPANNDELNAAYAAAKGRTMGVTLAEYITNLEKDFQISQLNREVNDKYARAYMRCLNDIIALAKKSLP